jgi:hypothetical protein
MKAKTTPLHDPIAERESLMAQVLGEVRALLAQLPAARG